jgi:hypothetical protein
MAGLLDGYPQGEAAGLLDRYGYVPTWDGFMPSSPNAYGGGITPSPSVANDPWKRFQPVERTPAPQSDIGWGGTFPTVGSALGELFGVRSAEAAQKWDPLHSRGKPPLVEDGGAGGGFGGGSIGGTSGLFGLLSSRPALPAPPKLLALPAPPIRPALPPPAPVPALPAPPILPALPAPPARLALPPPSGAPAWLGTIGAGPSPGFTGYRVWGGTTREVGPWLTLAPPNSASAAIRDLALPAGNTAQFVSPVYVPPRIQYQWGKAAPNFGRPGGGSQLLLLEKQLDPNNFGPGITLPP